MYRCRSYVPVEGTATPTRGFSNPASLPPEVYVLGALNQMTTVAAAGALTSVVDVVLRQEFALLSVTALLGVSVTIAPATPRVKYVVLAFGVRLPLYWPVRPLPELSAAVVVVVPVSSSFQYRYGPSALTWVV